MKLIPLFYLALLLTLVAKEIRQVGLISEDKWGREGVTTEVEYSYSAQRVLSLKIKGLELNSAATAVSALIRVQGDVIKIDPAAVIDEGRHDSLKSCVVSYEIKDIRRRRYRIEHDERATEGRQRLVAFDVKMNVLYSLSFPLSMS
ncbi:MAG: hypothetical protein ACON4R_13495 [Akkermansiaceae bacterium]